MAGIVCPPLTDVRIAISTSVAWRAENRSPLARALVAELPTAEAAPAG